MKTLKEFSAEIDRLAAAAESEPLEMVPDRFGEPGQVWAQWHDARIRLRELSREVRRMCWRDRKAAVAIADRADAEAEKIETRHGCTLGSRMNMHDSVCVGGVWTPVIQ